MTLNTFNFVHQLTMIVACNLDSDELKLDFCVEKWKVPLNILSTFIEAFGKSPYELIYLVESQQVIPGPLSPSKSAKIALWAELKF